MLAIKDYSQLPLHPTPLGPQVNVLNSESRNGGNLFQSNVCAVFFPGI